MWWDKMREAKSILLVGECNFSFTISLLRYVHSHTAIISTCFETDPDVQPRKKNIETLQAKGVQILLGVDATKLSEFKELQKCFDYVIFNFPHVGGKSRIHLNHELLRCFFSSAAAHLNSTNENSRVLVSLCRGQGGICEDQPRRPKTYGDTWKVVEMAAYGGLILKRIEPFLADNFPEYNPSGYGKQGKGGFHTLGSLTYLFGKSRLSRSGLPLTGENFHSESIHEILAPGSIKTPFGIISCSGFHARAYNDNPLKRDPINHLLKHIVKYTFSQNVIDSDLEFPLHIMQSTQIKLADAFNGSSFNKEKLLKKLPARCKIDHNLALLRDSLIHCIPHVPVSNKVNLAVGHVFHDFSPDFSVPPVGIEAMLWGNGATAATLDILTKLVGKGGQCLLRLPSKEISEGFFSSGHYLNHLCYEIVYLDQMKVLGLVFRELFDVGEVCTINLDSVAVVVYGADDWRELRTKGCKSLSCGDKSADSTYFSNEKLFLKNKLIGCEISMCSTFKIIPESLYPPTFTFDVSFSLSNTFSDRQFWSLLWHIIGDIVTKVELIDSYCPPQDKVALGHKQSWCFRLNYHSFEWPLHRKSAVKIQNEVVNWALVNVLGLSIN